MNQRCLCQRWQGLVHTVDYQIRPQLHGGLRENLMHAEMGPVCFINDQGNPVPVRDFGNRPHIRDDPIVCWRCDINRLDSRILRKRPLNLRRISRLPAVQLCQAICL